MGIVLKLPVALISAHVKYTKASDHKDIARNADETSFSHNLFNAGNLLNRVTGNIPFPHQ